MPFTINSPYALCIPFLFSPAFSSPTIRCTPQTQSASVQQVVEHGTPTIKFDGMNCLKLIVNNKHILLIRYDQKLNKTSKAKVTLSGAHFCLIQSYFCFLFFPIIFRFVVSWTKANYLPRN
jgi:hypothetical protein